MICLYTACQEKDPDAIIYYRATGKGYVYDATSNKPLQGIIIEICYRGVQNFFPLFPQNSECDIVDTVVTDKNGCYKVRFIEKHRPSNKSVYLAIRGYRIYVKDQKSKYPNWNVNYPNTSDTYIHVWSSDYLNETDILALDTIKFYKTNN